MIEVRDLSKRYGDKVAVDHLTFTVKPGRVTGSLGPNGAGKSTTMRLVLGLDPVTSCRRGRDSGCSARGRRRC
jgi:ABC-2 type transport system ATP-binding protein